MLKGALKGLKIVWLLSLDIFCYVGLAYVIREVLPMAGYSLWLHPIYLGLILWATYMVVATTIEVRRRRAERERAVAFYKAFFKSMMADQRDEDSDAQD